MKKTLQALSYASNIELLKKVIVACKQRLMSGKPLEKFPHYWALIPVEHKREINGKKDFRE
jgi:hypothetical protein